MLEQINGVYIPGDTKMSYLNSEYQFTILNVLSWAQRHNSVDDGHFPVAAMGYGFAAMIESQLETTNKLDLMPSDMVNQAMQQNLNLLPKETFVYDEIPAQELERTFDLVSFYNDLDVGITLERFNSLKRLKPFVPVATYESAAAAERSQEFVSMIEGTYMPFFAFAHRLDKVQFGFHAAAGSEEHSRVDHSKYAVEHAQHVANLIVDEARLSANAYEWTNDEQAALLTHNNDAVSVSLPTPAFSDNQDSYSLNDFYRTEMYLF